jgi:hypothetical protein
VIQTSTTTEQIVGEFLQYAHPIWVTVDEIANEISPYRSEQAIRQSLARMINNNTATRRISERPRAPYEYRTEASK